MSKPDLQSAVERARMVAAKITGQLTNEGPTKRGADSGDDEGSSKKFASINDAVGAQLAMFKSQQGGSSSNKEDYMIPDKVVGLVIGKGGTQLHQLQAETQCKIIITPPDGSGSPNRILNLIGAKDAIERCKKAIDAIVNRNNDNDRGGGGGGYHRSNLETFEMQLPGNKCGLVIGKGGETIKRLGETYGVKLVVVQDQSQGMGGDKPLRITGEPDKVAKAREAVLELIKPREDMGGRGGPGDRGDRGPGGGGYGGGGGPGEYGGRRSLAPGQSEAFCKVPGDKAGIVIGKGGESIKEINRRSGAHVEIDKSQRGQQSDGSDKMFVIRGTNEQIQYAQQLIYERITGERGDRGGSSPSRRGGDGGGGGGGGGAGGYGYDPSAMYDQSQMAGYAQQAAAAQQQPWGANPYQQAWQQQQPTDPKAIADPNVSAAWAAYYQQYYGQAGVPGQPAAPGGVPAAAGAAAGAATPAAGAASTGAGGSTPTGGAATAAAGTAAQASINPQTGQADYSQAWVEYYRSLGMYAEADAILRQTQQSQTNGTPGPSDSASSGAAVNGSSGGSSGGAGSQQQQQNGNSGGSSNGNGNWPGYGGSGGSGSNNGSGGSGSNY